MMDFIFSFIILIFSIIAHEYAHAWTAWRLGDSTAKDMGRLTLNPLAHIDLFGTILLPLLLIMAGIRPIGWAKPVPYNPYNLRNPKRDSWLVAISGPSANFIIALVFGVLIRFLSNSNLTIFFLNIVAMNVLLLVFNLIPIPPLDGSKVLFAILPNFANNAKMFLERYGFFILLIFIYFGFQLIVPIISLLVGLIVGSNVII